MEYALKCGVCNGNLWIQPETEYRPPKVVYCFKCVRFGHISGFCKSRTNSVAFVLKTATITRTVPTGETKSERKM